MMNPKVYISVLNWYNYKVTIDCIRSLLKMDYSNFEIIVVDNNSKNDSVKIIRNEFPTLHIIESKTNLGYAGGNKLASDLALVNNVDLFWVLNNDTTVRINTLTELVKSYNIHGDAIYSNLTLMSEDPDIIHYSGSYLPNEESVKKNTYDKLKGRLLSEVFEQLEDKEARIYGHSLLIPTTVIKNFGFMDTEFFMFCEEADYFKTLEKYKVKTRFVKKAIILHESSGSFKKEGNIDNQLKLPLLYYSRRNQYYFDMKWNNLKKSEIIRERGGWFNVAKFFLKTKFSSISKLEENYMINLAAIHAYKGVRGKTIDPSDFR